MSNASSQILTPWNLAAAIFGFSIALMWPTLAALFDYWGNTNRYSHWPLIVGISAYLFYRQREQLNSLASVTNVPGLVLLVAFITIWMIAVLASVQAIQFVILPLILWLMVLSVLGWRSALLVVLPVAYLYLAIPIWESGNFVLQWVTVRAVEFALWVFQIPAFIQGNRISLPAGSFAVDGGCSGLHYFIIGISLSVLYGALYLRSNWNRLLLVGVAVGLALFTNWLRVFIVVYAGHLTDMQHYLVTHNHYYFGWVLFVIGLVPYLNFARRLERSESQDARHEDTTSNYRSSVPGRGPLVALSICTIMLLVSSGLIYATMHSPRSIEAHLVLPPAQGAWTVEQSISPDWQPHFVGAAAERTGSYRSESGVVDMYANLYLEQVQGRELIGYENRAEGLSGWRQVRVSTTHVNLGGTADVRLVREIQLIADSGETRLAFLWYDIDGKPMVNDLSAKLRIGANLLVGRRAAGVRTLSASCGVNCDDARQLLQNWMVAHAGTDGEKG